MTCWGAGLIALTFAATAMAADTSSAPKTGAPAARTWADVAKWPDFQGGIWVQQRGPRSAANANEKPSYQAAVAARLAAIGPINPASLGSATCEPIGGPFERTGEFFYSKNSIFIMMDEDYLSVRHIYMDGRSHGDPDLSYYGHSVGHWEGDTLVIDTVAVSPSIKLFDLQAGANLHIVERVRLLDPNRLEWRYTVTDPDILAQPWEFRSTFKRHKDWEIQASSCAEGNRDMRNEDGTPSVDLTPK